MAQCFNFMQGTPFANGYSLSELPNKLFLQFQCNSCSYRGKHNPVGRFLGFQSPSDGYTDVINTVPKPSYKAEVCDTEDGFPHIQTLRRFPVSDLAQKVVMVRFDSSILLQNELDRNTSSFTNALLTIKYLYKAGAKVILTSSWNDGRNPELLSLENVAEFLSSVLQVKVTPVNCSSMYPLLKMEWREREELLLLENLSIYKQEAANASEFAESLASGVDIFINDSFSLAHKVLASTVGVTRFCHACLAGFYFEECLHRLRNITKRNRNPYIAIIGGGNLVKKSRALHFLASRCDALVFVGMMAFQILHALGKPVPLQLVELRAVGEARGLIEQAKAINMPIVLPKDFWCRNSQDCAYLQLFPAHGIVDGWEPVDIGPNSLDEIACLLSGCKKVTWIGPVKFGPSDQNTEGTAKVAAMLDNLSRSNCDVTVVGNLVCKAVSMISISSPACHMIETASIVWEFLKGRSLAGVMALDRAYPFEIAWKNVYYDPTRPLAVDIGSGNGLFLMGMASLRNDLNFLGLEINDKLVSRCLVSVRQSGMKNVHFITTNATSTFRTIVSSYPGKLVLVAIQCPNPDFNEPDHRWRMVQRSLVEGIADLLTPGGKVFLQSDVEAVAVRMREQFLKEGKGKLALVYDKNDVIFQPGGWLKENPFGVRSDWERHVLARRAPMFRLMLSKRDAS